jgi:hypothetical protein
MKLKTFVSTLASVLLIGSQVAYADKWGDQFPHIAGKATSRAMINEKR